MFTNPITSPITNRAHNGANNRRWLGFELSVLRRLKFSSIAIPFAGQPDLGWYLKFWGKQVLDNDLCQWAWWASRALVENPGETLTEEDVSLVLSESYVPHRRLHNPALGQMMSEMDAVWFDNVWLNIQQIENEHRRALAILLALGVGDYTFSFTPETAELRRPLSEIFLALWRNQRRVVDNGKENYSVNRDAHEFIRGARAELMFVRFPRPEGLTRLRSGIAGWRETWVRGSDEAWDSLVTNQRGRLGDDVASKEHYLQLVANFLSRAKHIQQWAITHTEDGFITAAEMGNVIKQFRRVDVTYNKDFSDVIGGKNTFIIIA
ncbi:MAG TPA: hypothetical protein VGB07_17710 [Blastocatellia bacterium]